MTAAFKRTILVADDEQLIQKLVARALAPRAYRTLHANNGIEAFKTATLQRPDLILLDIDMPGKNGWQVLRELREHVHTRMVPIILLTGHRGVSDRVNGLSLGAEDYIAKPFDLEELIARVESALRRKLQDLSANPLTHLPGSPTIEQEVNQRIQKKIPFAFFYIDIDQFKPYNDVYGFACGDRVIRETARMLGKSLEAAKETQGFAGHIGGDDFVLLTSPERAPHVAQRLVTLFDRRSPGFYKPEDRKRGYIQTKNRQGASQRFPLLTLSVGIVTTEHRTLDHYAKVVQIASEMKTSLKSNPDHTLSRFAFDRRKDR